MSTNPINSNSHNQLIDSQFGNQASAYLDSKVHAQGPEFLVIEETLRACSLPSSQLQVLDLGCGAGHVSFCAAPFVDAVVAYDLAPQMLVTVNQAAIAKGLTNIKTVQGEAESLPFSDNSFDIILSRFSAHHWMDVGRALNEAKRVLKATGQLIMIDIAAPPLPLLDSFLQTIEMLRDPSHIRDYSTSQWVTLLAQAQFASESMTSHKLTLNFSEWVTRMQTPEHFVTSIRALQKNSGREVLDYFDIQTDGTFTTDVIILIAKPVH